MNYKSKRWQKLRASILRQDGYMDQVAKRYGKTIPATMVHHIYPVEQFPEFQWERWNLISLSNVTHNRMHDRNTNELTEEGKKLMARTVPGINWRQKNHQTK